MDKPLGLQILVTLWNDAHSNATYMAKPRCFHIKNVITKYFLRHMILESYFCAPVLLNLLNLCLQKW